MIDFNKEFTEYNKKIKITEPKKNRIKTSRDAVRDKVRNYYREELGYNQPKFRIQGSFTINTALQPLEGQEVDLDDGIYLQHINEGDDWPTPKDVHKDVMKALEDHTQDGCESKTSCVRVIYRNDYHIDLPVYIMSDEKAYLGQTNINDWINSDSKEFCNWFYENRENEQVNRVIRYIKGWRDYQGSKLTSIEISILSINSFSKKDNRDDLSLLNTLKSIVSTIETDRKVQKPVSPFEDLWEDFTDSQKDRQIKAYKDLLDDLEVAFNNSSNSKASIILKELFGDRFPKKEDEKKTSYREVTTGAKPWG